MDRNSSLDLLYPPLAALAKNFIWRCQNKGFNIEIFETWRSPERQNSLMRQEGITRAEAWKSWHNHGLAYDAVFRDGSGAWYWESDHWHDVGQIGKDLGLIWGGDFKSIVDKPHFQYETKGIDINEAYEISVKKGQGSIAVWAEIHLREYAKN